MLHYAVGWGVFGLGYFSITKVFGATLLALRGGAGWQLSMGKKRYITLEWPFAWFHFQWYHLQSGL